jgi:hypothetical protein
MQNARRFVRLPSVTFAALTVLAATWPNWIAALAVLAWWSIAIIRIWDATPIEMEVFADDFALRSLGDIAQVKKVISCKREVWADILTRRRPSRLSQLRTDAQAAFDDQQECHCIRERLRNMQKHEKLIDTLSKENRINEYFTRYTNRVRMYDGSTLFGHCVMVLAAVATSTLSAHAIAMMLVVPFLYLHTGIFYYTYGTLYRYEESLDQVLRHVHRVDVQQEASA